MKNSIYIIDDHHEAYYLWAKKKYNALSLIHIDSHHDMYTGNNFPWINNYVYYAVKTGIVRTCYWVVPEYFYNNKLNLEQKIKTIHGFQGLYQKDDLFIVELENNLNLFVLTIDMMSSVNMSHAFLLDIDIDFFIRNVLGALDPSCKHPLLYTSLISDLDKIKPFFMNCTCCTIAKSLYGGYVPIELSFIAELTAFWLKNNVLAIYRQQIEDYIFAYNNQQFFNHSESIGAVIGSSDIFSYWNILCLFNQQRYEEAKYLFSQINYKNISQRFIPYCSNHVYYQIKGNSDNAEKEVEKYLYLLDMPNYYKKYKGLLLHMQGSFNASLEYLQSSKHSNDFEILLTIEKNKQKLGLNCCTKILSNIISQLFSSLGQAPVTVEEYELNQIALEAINLSREIIL